MSPCHLRYVMYTYMRVSMGGGGNHFCYQEKNVVQCHCVNALFGNHGTVKGIPGNTFVLPPLKFGKRTCMLLSDEQYEHDEHAKIANSSVIIRHVPSVLEPKRINLAAFHARFKLVFGVVFTNSKLSQIYDSVRICSDECQITIGEMYSNSIKK